MHNGKMYYGPNFGGKKITHLGTLGAGKGKKK